MSRYAKTQQPDEERELRLAIMREELVGLLWRRVAIPDRLVSVALGVSDAAWQGTKATGDAPPRIMVNGRIFVRTDDLRAWLQSRPETTLTKGQRRAGNQQHDDDTDTAPHASRPNAAKPASFANTLLAASPKG